MQFGHVKGKDKTAELSKNYFPSKNRQISKIILSKDKIAFTLDVSKKLIIYHKG